MENTGVCRQAEHPLGAVAARQEQRWERIFRTRMVNNTVRSITLLLTAGCVVLIGSFMTRGFAEEVHCPETISVKQSLAKPEQGWNESTSDMPNRLAGVTFLDGPPEQKASLVNEGERVVKGKQISTWRFDSQSQIWLSCRYSGSNIVLSRALTRGTTVCSVTYNPRQTIAGLPSIEKIECR